MLVFDKRVKVYLVSAGSLDENEYTAGEENNHLDTINVLIHLRQGEQSLFQVTVGSLLGRMVGYPDSIS